MDLSISSKLSNLPCDSVGKTSIYKVQCRAAERLAGARGKFFLEATISNFFPKRKKKIMEKIFPDKYVEIAFQRLYLNFSYQISVLSPKNKYILPFARKYLTHKNE